MKGSTRDILALLLLIMVTFIAHMNEGFGWILIKIIAGVLAIILFIVIVFMTGRVSSGTSRPWEETWEMIDEELIRSIVHIYPKPFKNFVAIDFETANSKYDSACAVAVVVVESGQVTLQKSWLINPGTKHFRFTYLHGITYAMVKDQPYFPDIWPELRALIHGKEIVAHNAFFDHSVIKALVEKYELDIPRYGIVCTCELSRNKLPSLPNHRLDTVCNYLNIPLQHHDPESDALGAAQIALKIA